jgi:hypothetical protein
MRADKSHKSMDFMTNVSPNMETLMSGRIAALSLIISPLLRLSKLM